MKQDCGQHCGQYSPTFRFRVVFFIGRNQYGESLIFQNYFSNNRSPEKVNAMTLPSDLERAQRKNVSHTKLLGYIIDEK